MKNYIPVVFDTFFCSLTTFILCNFIFSLFLSSTLSSLFSVAVSLISALFFFKVFNKKKGKNALKKQDEERCKEMLIRLSFMRRTEVVELFCRIFAKLSVKTEVINGRLFLPEHGAIVFIKFDFDEVRKSEFIKYANLLHDDQIGIIFGRSFSSEIKEFSRNFNGKIKLFGGREVYSLLCKADIFPEKEVYFFKEKEKKWDFSLLLDKKRARSYFLFGITFLLYSLIVPIKIYYVIVGSLFLIFSLTIKVLGKNKEE